jgi:hypothetical protein
MAKSGVFCAHKADLILGVGHTKDGRMSSSVIASQTAARYYVITMNSNDTVRLLSLTAIAMILFSTIGLAAVMKISPEDSIAGIPTEFTITVPIEDLPGAPESTYLLWYLISPDGTLSQVVGDPSFGPSTYENRLMQARTSLILSTVGTYWLRLDISSPLGTSNWSFKISAFEVDIGFSAYYDRVPWINTEPRCCGTCVFTQWYWKYRRDQDGPIRLKYGEYEAGEIARAAQLICKTSTTGVSVYFLDDEQADVFQIVRELQSTGQPVLVALASDGGKVPYHTVLAYAWDGMKLHCYDPNSYPWKREKAGGYVERVSADSEDWHYKMAQGTLEYPEVSRHPDTSTLTEFRLEKLFDKARGLRIAPCGLRRPTSTV